MREHYDVIVIGSGPGGEGAAMTASKGGRRVAVIDQDAEVGGSCTHRGTIPSKALRHAIQQLAGDESGADPDYSDLMRKAEGVIRSQVELRRGFYERNHVDVIGGRATFVDAQRIEVAAVNGARHRLRADRIILATGSRPYRPPDVDFSHPRIVDSDTVLRLKETPRSITIYGAGVIGCEYASIFRGLRIKVNLINNRDKLLSFLDDEIIDALAYHLRERGVLIRHSEEYERVEADDAGVRVHLKSEQGDPERRAAVGAGPHRQLGRDGARSDRRRARTSAARSWSTRPTRPRSRTSTRSATWSAIPASPAPRTTRAASPPRTR